MIKINWNQVLTGVLTTFFSAIVVGAAAIVWKGATSVDEEVKKSTKHIVATAEYAKQAVDVFDKELDLSRDREAKLQISVDNIEMSILELAIAIKEIQEMVAPPTNAVRKQTRKMHDLSNSKTIHRKRSDPFEELEDQMGWEMEESEEPAAATKGAFSTDAYSYPSTIETPEPSERMTIQQQLPQLEFIK